MKVLSLLANSLLIVLLLTCCQLIMANDISMTLSAVASETEKKEEIKPSFPIGNRFSRGLQKYTGINMLTQFVGGKVAGYLIKREVGGKVKVKLKTYSLTDLIAGKIKSADISLEDSNVEGVPVSDITLNTKMPLWVSKHRVEGSYMKSPLAINVEGSVTQKDVTRALASHKIISSLRGLKLDLPGLGEQQLDIIDPEVAIEKDQLIIKGELITKGGAPDTGVPVVIKGEPVLEGNQRIVIKDLSVDSQYIVEPEKFADFVSELINPIVDFGRYDRRTHAFRLSSFDIANGKVDGAGELILVPVADKKDQKE